VLSDYAGTVLLVSHDRDFLDRLVTSVITRDPTGTPGKWIEYAGGYSDMVAQQAAGGQPPFGPSGHFPRKRGKKDGAERDTLPPPQAGEVSPTATEGNRQKRERLTFNEQHALKTLPGEMEKLQAEIKQLEAALADPSLFAKDPARFDKLAAALTAAQAGLAAAEERWLEIEIKREALENP
jgi:ATP-binding cassette subfamily F protein uup